MRGLIIDPHVPVSRACAKRAIGRSMTEAEARLIEEAGRKLGPKAVITDPKEIEPWVSDWRGRVHGVSPAILAPGSTEEVVEIVRLAAEHRVPLVPQGGRRDATRGRLGDPAVDAPDEPHPLGERREQARSGRGRRDPRDPARGRT